MAFSDPQTITVNAIANTLPRVGSGMGEGKFSKDDGNVVLTIRQRVTSKGRKQTSLRFDFAKVGVDPFNGTLNARYGESYTFSVDRGAVGYTNAESMLNANGVTLFLTSSAGANLLRLIGGES